jgi:glycosyltransferase involved in cell wall biosynthesis
MSVYNSSLYLKQAIDSILDQTYDNFEFIVINDGSTDESLGIIKSYSDNRIKLLENDGNKGLIYSLNKGIAAATGKFIARMDADDIALPNRIESQLRFFESHTDISICGSATYHLMGDKLTKKSTYLSHDEIICWMLFNCSIVHPTLMFRSEVLKNEEVIFDNSFPHAEDYELWSRLLFKYKLASLDEPLLKYRIHANQVTKKHNLLQETSANLVRRKILEQAGFVFNDNQFEAHCWIGTSRFLDSAQQLHRISDWLQSLYQQNKSAKYVSDDVMKLAVKKLWEDSCGNTNLGLRAFIIFFQSPLYHFGNAKILKLALKCFIRRFR